MDIPYEKFKDEASSLLYWGYTMSIDEIDDFLAKFGKEVYQDYSSISSKHMVRLIHPIVEKQAELLTWG